MDTHPSRLIVTTEDVLKASDWLSSNDLAPRPRQGGKTTEARTAKTHPTIYIAGPMTGYQDLNYHAFHYAAADLRAAGYRVLNPAENTRPNPTPTWTDWMRLAIGQLVQADAIALLPQWHSSRGARVERDLGRSLDLDVRYIRHWFDTPTYEKRRTLYKPIEYSK